MNLDKQNIFLRRAEISDALLTYKWAIDPVVRQNSINTESFSFDSHYIWFMNKIKSSNCHYFILMEKFPLGQIRFDKYQNGWLISFLIDELFRGMGLGTIIVQKGIEMLNPENFYAYVKTNNEASNRIFKNLSFVEIESDVANTKKWIRVLATY